jgi:hypothetical protein
VLKGALKAFPVLEGLPELLTGRISGKLMLLALFIRVSCLEIATYQGRQHGGTAFDF